MLTAYKERRALMIGLSLVIASSLMYLLYPNPLTGWLGGIGYGVGGCILNLDFLNKRFKA